MKAGGTEPQLLERERERETERERERDIAKPRMGVFEAAALHAQA